MNCAVCAGSAEALQCGSQPLKCQSLPLTLTVYKLNQMDPLRSLSLSFYKVSRNCAASKGLYDSDVFSVSSFAWVTEQLAINPSLPKFTTATNKPEYTCVNIGISCTIHDGTMKRQA